jgi:hypothetical protein
MYQTCEIVITLFQGYASHYFDLLIARYLERMVCQLIPATMQLRDSKTNARCDISGTVTELSNVKWNDKKVK